jgi:hypothetical protein
MPFVGVDSRLPIGTRGARNGSGCECGVILLFPSYEQPSPRSLRAETPAH